MVDVDLRGKEQKFSFQELCTMIKDKILEVMQDEK